MFYKEYLLENGDQDISKLRNDFISEKEYSFIHQNMPILCCDAMIWYKRGFLLLKRDNLPAKDMYFPVGGRVRRGMFILDSIRERAKIECNLEIKNIILMGFAHVAFEADPFDHGKGTDTPSRMCLAEGFGEVRLDKLHKDYIIVKPEEVTPKFLEKLHPYVKDMLVLAIGAQKKKILPIKLKPN